MLESHGCWTETTLCARRRVASQETLARAGEGTHWLLAAVT